MWIESASTQTEFTFVKGFEKNSCLKTLKSPQGWNFQPLRAFRVIYQNCAVIFGPKVKHSAL
jgi:hypothetical protein